MVDDSLNDHVIISGVCDIEHHEIAVHEGLTTTADALGEQDVVALLTENLENGQATLQKAQQMASSSRREGLRWRSGSPARVDRRRLRR